MQAEVCTVIFYGEVHPREPSRTSERTQPMKTTTAAPRIFVFDAPSPKLLEEIGTDYYRECQIAGAASVEVELRDHSVVVISATRYLPVGVSVSAVVADDVLQVLCTRGSGERVIMREFTDWISYTVHRATR